MTQTLQPVQWYAYNHSNGTVHVKRYFDVRDIEDCIESPFVTQHTGPFAAPDREQAMAMAVRRLS